MSELVDLNRAVMARNDDLAAALRADLAAAGTVAVNLLSAPGTGKTALTERLLTGLAEREIPAAALTGDLATENDARRLATTGAPVRQITTGGMCHLEAHLVRDHLRDWLPAGTRVLIIENVGNLVCPAGFDLGESLRIVLSSVTEGEDKPVKYPTAYRWADLAVLTKIDLAVPCEFDEDAFRRAVRSVDVDLPILRTSARTGQGVPELLDILQYLPARDPATDTATDVPAGPTDTDTGRG
ncbi:MAG: hydrogenase nickel incorporation protein HypB [Actinomycetota bacterium]|nr:hydrogenase nickel incorporation protein HypB [Actinomycetota bacterium]